MAGDLSPAVYAVTTSDGMTHVGLIPLSQRSGESTGVSVVKVDPALCVSGKPKAQGYVSIPPLVLSLTDIDGSIHRACIPPSYFRLGSSKTHRVPLATGSGGEKYNLVVHMTSHGVEDVSTRISGHPKFDTPFTVGSYIANFAPTLSSTGSGIVGYTLASWSIEDSSGGGDGVWVGGSVIVLTESDASTSFDKKSKVFSAGEFVSDGKFQLVYDTRWNSELLPVVVRNSISKETWQVGVLSRLIYASECSSGGSTSPCVDCYHAECVRSPSQLVFSVRKSSASGSNLVIRRGVAVLVKSIRGTEPTPFSPRDLEYGFVDENGEKIDGDPFNYDEWVPQYCEYQYATLTCDGVGKTHIFYNGSPTRHLGINLRKILGYDYDVLQFISPKTHYAICVFNGEIFDGEARLFTKDQNNSSLSSFYGSFTLYSDSGNTMVLSAPKYLRENVDLPNGMLLVTTPDVSRQSHERIFVLSEYESSANSWVYIDPTLAVFDGGVNSNPTVTPKIIISQDDLTYTMECVNVLDGSVLSWQKSESLSYLGWDSGRIVGSVFTKFGTVKGIDPILNVECSPLTGVSHKLVVSVVGTSCSLTPSTGTFTLSRWIPSLFGMVWEFVSDTNSSFKVLIRKTGIDDSGSRYFVEFFDGDEVLASASYNPYPTDGIVCSGYGSLVGTITLAPSGGTVEISSCKVESVMITAVS
jgi:hypothetical protein